MRRIVARLLGGQDLTPEEERAVAQAFERVPERQRSAVWLIDMEGLSSEEVATVLGTSPENAARLARRGRSRWRAEYLSRPR